MIEACENLATAWETLADEIDTSIAPDYAKCLRECAHHLRNQIAIFKGKKNLESEKHLITTNKAFWLRN